MKNFFSIITCLVLVLSVNILFAQVEKEYYENGQLESSVEYDSDGNEHGEWKFYFENGQVEILENYDHGIGIGNWESYYENGQLETKGSLGIDGYATGIHESYFENGQLWYKGEYAKDEAIKEWNIYFSNGNLQGKLSFNNGKPNGAFLVNFENGKNRVEGNYSPAGKKSGNWKIYYPTGQLRADVTYENDLIKLVNSCFDAAGTALTALEDKESPTKGVWYDANEDKIEDLDYWGVFLMF